MRRALLGLPLGLMASAAHAYTVWGEVWPVAEQSLIKTFQAHAPSKSQQAPVAAYARRPKALGLMRAVKRRKFTVLPQAEQQAQGGFTTVNVLADYPNQAVDWRFINSDDKAQWRYLLATIHPDTTVILTQGDVSACSQALQRACYFDQAGAITQRLGIGAVPASLKRRGEVLEVVELKVNEQGRVG